MRWKKSSKKPVPSKAANWLSDSGKRHAIAGLMLAAIETGGTKCVAALAEAPGKIQRRIEVPTTFPDETFARLRDALGNAGLKRFRVDARSRLRVSNCSVCRKRIGARMARHLL